MKRPGLARLRRVAGFSLLEAIVALTILGIVLMGAWTWIGNGMRALDTVRGLALEQAAVDGALAALEQEDFSAHASGTLDWRGHRIEWRATPALPMRRGMTNVGAASAWQFTLYDVEMRLFSDRDQLIAEPRVRMLRYARAATAGAGGEE